MFKFRPAPIRGLGLCLVILLGVLGLSACGDTTAAPATTAGPVSGGQAAPLATKAAVGSLAPDFNLTAVDGKPLRLSDLRGKAVVLNYWAVY